MYKGRYEVQSDLSYVLAFALHVIRENNLEHVMSAERWNIVESLEEQINISKKVAR